MTQTIFAATPDITPNTTGLPGTALATQIVGALLTFGICAVIQPADGYSLSSLVPWHIFDGDATGATRAFGAGAENRTPIPSLENLYTNRCTTPAW